MLYVSHSVSPVELGQVYALAQRLGGQGEQALIAHRNWSPDGPMPAELALSLSGAHAIVLFVSSNGQFLQWVNAEYRLGSGKPAVALVEQGIRVSGLPPERLIIFGKGMDINDTVARAALLIQNLRAEKQTSNALAALVVGGLILLVLGSLGGDKK